MRMTHWIPHWGVLDISYRKEKSQRHLAMKVLEPIHLHTAGFVQACQHLLDLLHLALRCCCPFNHPQRPSDVLSRSIPLASLRVSLIVANTITAEWRAFTVLEDERKSLVLRLVVRTLYFGAFVLIYWRYSEMQHGRRWRICDLRKRVTLADQIQIWKFKFKWILRIKSKLSKLTKYCNKV